MQKAGANLNADREDEQDQPEFTHEFQHFRGKVQPRHAGPMAHEQPRKQHPADAKPDAAPVQPAQKQPEAAPESASAAEASATSDMEWRKLKRAMVAASLCGLPPLGARNPRLPRRNVKAGLRKPALHRLRRGARCRVGAGRSVQIGHRID